MAMFVPRRPSTKTLAADQRAHRVISEHTATNALLALFVTEDGDGRQPDLVHADPGTHALLMGVDKYPHLTGGDGPSSKAADGMQQLSSPIPPAQLRTGCSPSTGFRTSGWPVIPSC